MDLKKIFYLCNCDSGRDKSGEDTEEYILNNKFPLNKIKYFSDEINQEPNINIFRNSSVFFFRIKNIKDLYSYYENFINYKILLIPSYINNKLMIEQNILNYSNLDILDKNDLFIQEADIRIINCDLTDNGLLFNIFENNGYKIENYDMYLNRLIFESDVDYHIVGCKQENEKLIKKFNMSFRNNESFKTSEKKSNYPIINIKLDKNNMYIIDLLVNNTSDIELILIKNIFFIYFETNIWKNFSINDKYSLKPNNDYSHSTNITTNIKQDQYNITFIKIIFEYHWKKYSDEMEIKTTNFTIIKNIIDL